MKKLPWIPLYLEKILGSKRWQNMKDFQRGWYIQMLLQCADNSERPGYLKLDSNLWTIAGASRRDFWDCHKSAVMACFKVREMDGQEWLYNERLLETMVEQNAKVNKGVRRKTDSEDIFSLSIYEAATVLELKNKPQAIEDIYSSYPRKIGKRDALVAIGRSVTRLLAGAECPSEIFKTTDDALAFLLGRTKLFSTSPAGQNGIFTPHPATWFNRSSYLDDELEWSKNGTHQQSTKPSRAREVASNNLAAAAAVGWGSAHTGAVAVERTDLGGDSTMAGEVKRLSGKPS